jgi:hypothetical protein
MTTKIFMRLLRGQKVSVEPILVAKLINYCLSVSGDYTLEIEIKKDTVKAKMV